MYWNFHYILTAELFCLRIRQVIDDVLNSQEQ